MAENKTKATALSVEAYLQAIPDEARRADCVALTRLMEQATQHPPRMWGTAIVGFGSYHYVYDSGREGDACLVGFSSRKGDISLYGLMAAPDHDALLPRLGRHKAGKGCVYIRRLGDVDLAVLAKLVTEAASAKARSHCEGTQST